MSNKRFSIQRSREVLYIVFAATLLVLVFSPSAWANKAQRHICKAGLNIGQAEARVYLFGRNFTGPIPGEQITAIATNLANASAEIVAAEALFGEPFATERARKGSAAKVGREIDRYAAHTSGWSYQHRASYIRSIAEMYRSSLGITFVSSRPDAFQKNENCDSILFNLCYHYGRATIGSSFDPGWEYRGSAGLIPQIIRDGLAVAMDPGHRPFDGHHKKICCTFGSPAAWSSFPSFRGTSPPSLYAANDSYLLGIIGNATSLDPVCGSGDKYVCPSSRLHGSGGKFAGTWECKIAQSLLSESKGTYLTTEYTLTITQTGSKVRGDIGVRIGGTVSSSRMEGTVRGTKMELTGKSDEGTPFVMTSTLSSNGRQMDVAVGRYSKSGEFLSTPYSTCYK